MKAAERQLFFCREGFQYKDPEQILRVAGLLRTLPTFHSLSVFFSMALRLTKPAKTNDKNNFES